MRLRKPSSMGMLFGTGLLELLKKEGAVLCRWSGLSISNSSDGRSPE